MLQTSQSTEQVMRSKLVMWPVQPIMFGERQNSSRGVYFDSGKTDIAGVMQNYWYRHQLSAMKK